MSHRVCKSYLILSIASLCFGQVTVANEPVSPTLLCGPTDVCIADASANAERIDEWLGSHTLPFQVRYPADPITTREITVDDIASLRTAVSTSGTRVILAPGVYDGSVRLATASDIDVVAVGANINGDLSVGSGDNTRPARIRWTGGTVNGVFEFEKGTDFLVDGLYNLNSSGAATPANWTGGPGDGSRYNRERFAVINSTFVVRNAPSSGGWTIYQKPPVNGERSDGIGHTDWIMANVVINSNAQNFRVGGFERAVFVRTYWNSDNRSTNGPRWESTINDLYIGDSVAVGSTIEGSGTIANATIVNWARYHSLSNVYLNMFDSAVNSRVNDSTFYDSGTGPTGGEISLGQAIGSNNIIRDWDGSTLPSDSTYGAPAAPQ